MKKCPKCQLELEDSFYNKRKNGKLQGYCKKCYSEIVSEWHAKNKEKAKETRIYRREKKYEWFESYKKTLSCVKCGESHPATLDFHHRDPSEKDFQISTMRRGGWSIERVKEEIEKCDILCANCHRIIHYNDD